MTNSMVLDGVTMGIGHPAYIIAEIGSNHNRDIETAKKLIRVSKDAGCNAVKFQSYTADGLYSIYTPRISEMEGRSKAAETPYELIKRIQMPVEWHSELKRYCDKVGITFCSTPFDESMVGVLESVGTPYYKIASYEITHFPLIEMVAKTGKPVIISTGNSDLADVETAIAVLHKNGCDRYAVLHCVSQYPAKHEDMNLRCIGTLRDRFGCIVGFSDHSTDPLSSMIAVGLGASIIEKHITLDRGYPGPDHPFALDPADLKDLVDKVRLTETILGTAEKRVLASEEENHRIGRRSIIAATDIQQDMAITASMLVIKRPALGIHPHHLLEVIGRKTARPIRRDEWITWDDLR